MTERSPYVSPLFYFVVGAVSGAGVALLLAPQSGRSTRQMMKSKLREGADSARRLRDRMVTRGEDAWDEAAQRVGEAASALSGGGAERKPAKRAEAASA